MGGTYNATDALNTTNSFTDKAADVCTVEGVAGGNRVPGVVTTLALPNNTCDLDNRNACGTNGDFECDLTTTAGDVCKCEAAAVGTTAAGSDSCMKYSPCIRTPCKVCSDCLADMAAFASQQQYALTKADLAAAFRPYCLSKSYTSASCAAGAAKILDQATPLPFGKRAGSLCAVMSMCSATAMPSSCVLKPTANLNGTGSGALDLCTVEGVVAGKDVQGSTRDTINLPAGRCDTDAGCNTDGNNKYMCNLNLAAELCTCYNGEDKCRALGTCQLRPCPACQQCLEDFQSVTPGSFLATCTSKRSAIACSNANNSITNSFLQNAGSRAGAACQLLGECSPARMAGCNLTAGSLAASPFSPCTAEGTTAGAALTASGSLEFTVDKRVYASGRCIADAECNATAGEFCSMDIPLTPRRACMCSSTTGTDSCVPLGECRVRPCNRCQACLEDMAPAIAAEIAKDTSARVSTAPCAANAAKYDACTAINTAYVSPASMSGLFGLRAGSLCRALGMCTGLPAGCRLRAAVAGSDITAALDLCTVEGVVGGSPVSDADCGADMQCDRSDVKFSYRCQAGLDTEVKRGTCVAKPPPVDTTIPPCTRCGLCLNNVRASVEIAALNTTTTPAELATNFYTACSAANYSLAACSSVQAAIASSYRGNLARRAGALCLRMRECTGSLSTDSTCVLSSAVTAAIVIDASAAPAALFGSAADATANATHNATDAESLNGTAVVDTNATAAGNTTSANATTVPAIPLVRGMLDACTVEGVSTGMRVAGTFRFGAAVNNTCLLDSNCKSNEFCSSDATVLVCRCSGAIDSCDTLPTCRPIPAAPTPPPVLSSCDRCKQCITAMQPFVTATSTDAQALASSFMQFCTTNMTSSVLACKPVSDAIAYSKDGILAKRAGAVCSRLQQCTDDLLLPTARCNLTGATASGPLNLCSTQGVANNTCRVDTDCLANNATSYDGSLVCSMAAPTEFCTCSRGLETCVRLGSCKNFCESRADYLNSINAEVDKVACSGPFHDCGAGRECKASSQCQRLECDAKDGIKKTACYGFCMIADRKVLAARMDGNGRTINVVLNTAAAPGSFACASIFNADTAAILGSDAWCSVSGKELKIDLGRSATIMPGTDSLTVATSQSVLTDLLLSSATFSGAAVPVVKCEPCNPPTVTLMGPQLVSEPCDPSTAADITIDASFSKDGSGRPLARISWAQASNAQGADVTETADVVLAAAVDQANTANNGAGAYRITIPAAQLASMSNGKYFVKATVTNYLGATESSMWTFTKAAAGTAPVIVPLATGAVGYRVAQGVRVGVQLVAASVCSGKQVEFLWESLDTPAWTAIPAGYNKKDLVIPGPVPGNIAAKVVRVTAKFAGADVNTSMEITLTPLSSPLVARLRGPSGDIPDTRTIVLNAAGSVDPDDPQGVSPLSVTWECIRADFPETCFTGINSFGKQDGLTWNLPASLLTPNIEHTFRVTVKRASDSAIASDSVVLKPTTAKIPTGRIRRVCGVGACPARHSVDDALSLTMALDAGSETAIVTWSVEQIPTLAAATGQDFTITAGNLPKTGFVTVRAVVAQGSAQSTTRTTIPINGKPECAGTCTLKAVGFSDDQPGLRFDFGVKDARDARQVVSSSPAPTVCAVDSDRAQTCAETVVTVQEAPIDFKVADAITAFDVTQLKNAGDVSVLASGAQALQSLSSFAGRADVAAGKTEQETALVVSAVATLTKATTQLSQDSKQKMLNVASSGTAAAQLSKKPLAAPDAARILSVLAAGNSMRDVCKIAAVCNAQKAATRHLLGLSMPELDLPVSGEATDFSRRMLQDGDALNAAGTNETATNTTDPAAPAEAAPVPVEEPVAAPAAAPAFVPAFAEQATTVADLLAPSATPATSYLSGGDNGLTYAAPSTVVVAGPALDASGSSASASAADNVQVQFSKTLTAACVDEEGTVLSDAPCSDVVVPVRVSYTPDATALLKPAATGRKLAAATAVPGDFSVVSGAVTVEAPGAAAGALPCDGCTATVTIPIWEEKQADTLYHCAQIVDGVAVIDAAVVTAMDVTMSETSPAVPIVSCVVKAAGSYLVGKALDPNRDLGNSGTDTYTPQANWPKPGEPIRVKLSFATLPSFDFDAFIVDSGKVEAFKATVKSLLVAGIAARIPAANGIVGDAIKLTNLRKGSIMVDVELDTSSITDGAVMAQLVGTVLNDPASLLSNDPVAWAKFISDYSLTGVVTAELISLQAPAANNMAAIVGGVVGGVGGALLIAAVAVFLVRRRRQAGVEPRNRQLLEEQGV
ncbi:hypothetical protein COO60DRAFT_1674268 [Scenedesmus sp. NREL 46B-D3]|nr:hypothetical protein COO60DRAFT_1674268 [Scenedesmus sp. NREL 46B-D3]